MAGARTSGTHALQLHLLLIMLLLAAGVQRSHSNIERDALQAFRAGVSGASSSGALQSWNSTSHFCRWPGVACTDGHVTSLNVSSLGLTGTISPAIGNLTYLEYLVLEKNQLSGTIPDSIGSLRRLQYLDLCDNIGISGEIPESLRSCTSLRFLYLNNNSLTGAIPTWLGTFPNLTYLYLHLNSLSGKIPPSLGNLTKLQALRVDENYLQGSLPLGLMDLPSLQTFSAYQNLLQGEIPPGFFNMSSLQFLALTNNAFHGVLPPDAGARITIPEGIGNIKNLIELGMQGNRLTGPIPSSIGNLTQLLQLDLSSNTLNGSIPHTLGNLNRLTSLNLSGNALTGHLPKQLDNCKSLEFLDLDGNFFDGSIPPSLSKLKGLRRLNLASNRLSGSIPPDLSQMSGLQELYLSRNDLTGTIPEELENLTSLIELDLSYNNLDGSVPLRGIFTNISGFKITGNANLCGGIPELDLPRCPAARNTHPTRWLLQIVVPVLSIALFLAILLSMFQWYRKRPGQAIKTDDDATLDDVLDEMNYQRISYAELDKATNSFADTNLIGVGKFGSVYLGTLPLLLKGTSAPDKVAVAVKVFDLCQIGASKTFVSECEALRNIRHRNLVRIITCCVSVDARGNDFRALVFEFMPNYSLDRWLNMNPKSEELKIMKNLSVIQRLNISVDIADALCYLHTNSVPQIIHCDVKPSNVLLSDDMRAVVGDFGLAKLLLEPGSHDTCSTTSTGGLRGTIGYIPPEYGTTGKVSTYGDVYSFGITLLEIFTGRSPTDDAFKDGLTLLEFVAASFPDKIEHVLDPALLLVEGIDGQVSCGSNDGGAHISEHKCLVSAVRVGLSCTRAVPFQRLSMKDAATELRSIRAACVSLAG
ncbi:hypothetical protein SORBI_3005G131600 [Sorghum bicolor]|uniref:Receptor kinase-like protein Xa21 n=1 Tax=Sorghum bicolor TaxID=4558 RepID=A0A1Z5RJK6_SORBI|nr:hypothetical protein SORBI_3005G131600 [Sorghum bicolor]